MTKKLSAVLFAAAAMCLSLGQANAGTITWMPSVDLFAGGNNTDFISQNGTFVAGFNGGSPDGNANPDANTPANAITTTVGTSVFTGATFAMLNAGITQNGVTLTGNWTNGAGPSTFGDGEFNSVADANNLLNSALYNGTNFTMSGLTVGNEYEMQILVNDARGGGGAGIRDEEWRVGFNDGAGGTTVAGLASLTNRPYNDSGSPNLAGDYIIGTFIADATTQSFDFVATRGNTNPTDFLVLGGALTNTNAGQAQFNAFQLRDITVAIPEPSSLVVLGLGSLLLVKRRRN